VRAHHSLTGAQGVWLALAYSLEFGGVNTYVYIWLASALMLVVNCAIIIRIMRAYKSRTPTEVINTIQQ
jgi:phosphatidylinositol glycan class M